IGEPLEKLDAFVHPVPALERDAQDLLVSGVVRPVVELEIRALLRAPNAPPGENAGDFDDVVLVVAAIDAERVNLEQLTGVVLVDSLGCRPHPLTLSPPCGE